MKDHNNPEYDDEAGMSYGSLHTINRAAQGLLETIKENDNLPEWCQEKISLAEDYLVTVWDYIQSEKEQDMPEAVNAAQQAAIAIAKKKEKGLEEHKKGVRAMKYTIKTKPQNLVAKNSMASLGGGAAGAHKDKKKAEKHPRKAKHKKETELAEGWYEFRLRTMLNEKTK